MTRVEAPYVAACVYPDKYLIGPHATADEARKAATRHAEDNAGTRCVAGERVEGATPGKWRYKIILTTGEGVGKGVAFR
jgi:hypothetical protein